MMLGNSLHSVWFIISKHLVMVVDIMHVHNKQCDDIELTV